MAFTILMVTMVPIGYLLDSTVAAANNARQKEAALQLADSWLEILSNSSPQETNGAIVTGQPFTPVAPAGAQTPIANTTDGTEYTVSAEYEWQSVKSGSGSGSSDLCSDGEPPSPAHPGVIQLHVKVTWNNGGSGDAVTDSTNIDYPQPQLQTDGYISLQVTNSELTDIYGNSSSTRLESTPVVIQPDTANGTPNGAPYADEYPDTNGCFFAQLPVGVYTVSLAQPTAGQPTSAFGGYGGSPQYVTTTGATNPSETITVTVNAEQTLSLSLGNAFDEGITSSLSYGGGAAVDGGVVCPGTNDLTCLTTGDGTSSSSVAWGDTSSNWNSANLANATHLNQVACTSAATPICVGVGYYTSNGKDIGAIVTTSSDFSVASADTPPPTIADITQVACPSANGCYALGLSTTGTPLLLAGAVGQSPLQDRWTILTPASGTAAMTLTGLSSIACPSSSTCEVSGSAALGSASSGPMILRLDGDPSAVASNSTWEPTFTTDAVPTAMTSVGEIVCPDSSQCLALGTGDSSTPTDPAIFTAPISSPSGQASTWINDTFPTGSTSVTGISCTSTNCIAIGTQPGASPAAVWSGSLAGNGSSDQWQLTTTPSIQAATAVACGQPGTNASASCEVAVVTSPGASELIQGSLAQNGGWAWNLSTGTNTNGAEYYTGLACETPPSSGNTACAAAGVTASGPIIVTSASGPTGSWSTQTPSLPGATVTGVPVETAPSLANWTTNVPYSSSSTTNASSLPILYPYFSGYSIAAGDCTTEGTLNGAAAVLAADPGGQANATIPLGLVSLQVLKSSGAPLSAATVTLTNANGNGCPADTYTLPLTDPDGITRIAVPYGTYTFSATAGSTTVPTDMDSATAEVSVSITVGPNSTAVTTTTLNPQKSLSTVYPFNPVTVTATTYLPNAAPVQG